MFPFSVTLKRRAQSTPSGSSGKDGSGTVTRFPGLQGTLSNSAVQRADRLSGGLAQRRRWSRARTTTKRCSTTR
jgi:hypothetical protein